MMIVVSAVGLIVVCVLLAVVCDRHFVPSLDIIAHRLRLPHDVSGATLMAIGSSAPELFTALIAVMRAGAKDVGPGTIVGSAIFNILVIVGASAFVSATVLDWKPVVRDMVFYLISILVLLWTFADGRIDSLESILYVAVYACYIAFLWVWAAYVPASAEQQDTEPPVPDGVIAPQKGIRRSVELLQRLVARSMPALTPSPARYVTVFLLSLVWIAVLSWLLVEAAVHLSVALGIPAVIISLTVLAAGTSVPDLLSSLIVAKGGRGDMAVSNAVGSNTFDILIGLGLPWLLYTAISGQMVSVNTASLASSVVLLFCTVAALLLLLIMRKFHVGRSSGLVLLLLYAAYVIYAAYGALHPEVFEWQIFAQ